MTMRVVKESPVQPSLNAEWERVELLGHCLLEGRQGRPISDEILTRLRELQDQVVLNRAPGGLWELAGVIDLSPLEYDILACVVAPEAEPRVGWLFQSVQPNVPQPYPSLALLQDLLAVDADEVSRLYAALAEGAPLRYRRLVRMEEGDPYQPIRPGQAVAARLLGRPRLSEAPPGAVPVRKSATWNDLVLPEACQRMLREFLLWVQHRETVVEAWGGGATGGPVAMFSGPSGTGKTYAASVLANALGWPLYRVDIGKLVSKYIGETEKNLNRLFDAAHGRPMVLQFDEADSLFGRRGEVKEARDRYANMEVSHLLARIEDHKGPCILTTNLREHLDQAFMRRFQMVVSFPRPSAEARAQLWAKLLPARAPREADIDPAMLGAAVSFTGGDIRNAALHAAYLAAGEARPISLTHVAIAVWREINKEGRVRARSDLGELAQHLPHWT